MANENEPVVTTISKGIARIALNRPQKSNALNGVFVADIRQALKNLLSDSAARVVLIEGHGEHFCAGGDIHWMQEMAEKSYETNYQDAHAIAELMHELYAFPKPTIALAHGTTLGGGLGLLTACDIAFASTNAIFGFSEVKLGIAPSTISPYVIAAIGQRMARYYFLTGQRFDAVEAKRIGLVHEVVAVNELLNAGLAMANKLLANSSQAMAGIKALIQGVAGQHLSEDIAQFTAGNLASLRMSADGQEGLKAFIEKRTAKWS